MNDSPGRPIVLPAIIIGISVILACCGIFGSYSWTFPIVALACLVFKKVEIRTFGLGLRGTWWQNAIAFGFAIGIGIIFGVACGIILHWFGIGNLPKDAPAIQGISFAASTGYKLAVAKESLANLIVYFGYYILLVGLGEELFWRGMIQSWLKSRLGMHFAIIFTGLLFGLIHFFLFLVLEPWQAIIFMGLIAFGGITWGYFFETFRCIWPIAISHGITSAIIWRYFFFTN